MNLGKQTNPILFSVSLLISFVLVFAFAFNTYAQPTHSSTNYGVDEVFFGSGGVNDANSASYNARASLGDLGVGNTESANFQAYGGFTTTDEPFIEFIVNATNVNLGDLSASATGTGTATFTIRTWLADGYIITNASDPPQNGSYTLSNLTSPTASSQGTEQFGINLVANTSPISYGADPVQLPDNTFSFGQVATDYNTANQFKYVKGDTLAFSNQSTSITQFTISYLMNVSDTTPGGTYVMNHNLVATSTY